MFLENYKKSPLLYTYQNGTYTVNIYKDGTKELIGETFNPNFPDSLDIKITNKCSNGCSFCYMNSNISGKCLNDPNELLKQLEGLPKGIELALGGGNLLEYDTSKFKYLLENLKLRGFVSNMTIHQNDISKLEKLDFLKDNIYGLGISVTDIDSLPKLIDLPNNFNHNNVVCHVIIGVVTPDIIDKLYGKGYKKVLVLGYKYKGRGKTKEPIETWEWRKFIFNKIRHSDIKDLIISFDNTGIEQLNIKGMLLKNEWDSIYSGQEFSHTMYVDAVEKHFGPTSFSKDNELVDWNTTSLINYFKNNHVKTFV